MCKSAHRYMQHQGALCWLKLCGMMLAGEKFDEGAFAHGGGGVIVSRWDSGLEDLARCQPLLAGDVCIASRDKKVHKGWQRLCGPWLSLVCRCRAAMQKFMAMYDECVERTLESRYGVYTDTQIALCMRLAGVKVRTCCVSLHRSAPAE